MVNFTCCVLYERDRSCRDLVDHDDKAAAATHADIDAAAAAAATTDVAVPYLAIPTEAGRYAFPDVGVGGGSVARHFEIL